MTDSLPRCLCFWSAHDLTSRDHPLTNLPTHLSQKTSAQHHQVTVATTTTTPSTLKHGRYGIKGLRERRFMGIEVVVQVERRRQLLRRGRRGLNLE